MWNINTRSKRSFHQIVYVYQSSLFLIIVVKTRKRADALRAIFICCANFFVSVHAFTVFFFAFCCTNWHIWWMNRHPLSLKGGATCFLMVHHAILRLILKYSFCASSSHELSVCAIFYVFYNSVFDIVWLWWQDYYNFKHQNNYSNFPLLCCWRT